jgi:hypothetical protein
MKKIIALIALSIMIASCDSPRSQRSILTSSKSGSALTNCTETGTCSSGLTPTDQNNTVVTTPTNSNVPSDASHCKFSTDGINGFESTSTHLGSYTLCQSSTDKTVFYVQVKTPPVSSTGDVKICFIPHTTTGSNSLYIGNPMCGSFTNPKELKKITFVKYTKFSGALINSVMFFKDTSYYYPMYGKSVMTLDAYKDCMYRLDYGVTSYCTSFKSVGQYILKSF